MLYSEYILISSLFYEGLIAVRVYLCLNSR